MGAAAEILSKVILPAGVDSATIREILPKEVRQRAFFSARTTEEAYLQRLRTLCSEVASGRMDNATARAEALNMLQEMGYQPEGKGLAERSSKRRLDLILDTQRKMAHNVARLKRETPLSREMFPAWFLARTGSRMVPRDDWQFRWKAAGDSVGWQGASRRYMCALKDSPIWQALGDGVGGFSDTLGNAYPPFAFSSGMGWISVPREECANLGLTLPAQPVAASEASLSPGQKEIREAAKKFGKDFTEDMFDAD